MVDNTLLFTAILMLAGGVVSGYLKGRSRDRVMRHFAGYDVTLELTDGRLVWGKMVLHPTGLELVYPSDVQDEHHFETSYILYKEEYVKIQAIYRYCDHMEDDQSQRRQRDLDRSFHPTLRRRLLRRGRNMLGEMLDSVGQAIGILAGHLHSRSTKGVISSGDDYIASVGQNIVGYAGTRYDPLLEHYVGARVVVEVTEGNVVYEHVGVLKDYTADFLEILDVHYPNQSAVQLKGEHDCSEDSHLCLRREGDMLYVSNSGDYSLFLQRLRIGDQVKPLQAVLDRDDEMELHLAPDTPADAIVEISVKIVRHLDWIVPRTHAVIRHKAEHYDPDQVFDIGFVLHLDRYTEAEEQYMRLLAEKPDNAPCALELGQILFQRGAMDDAEQWFQHALKYRHNLLDGGKLADRQLIYIRRKRARRRKAA